MWHFIVTLRQPTTFPLNRFSCCLPWNFFLSHGDKESMHRLPTYRSPVPGVRNRPWALIMMVNHYHDLSFSVASSESCPSVHEKLRSYNQLGLFVLYMIVSWLSGFLCQMSLVLPNSSRWHFFTAPRSQLLCGPCLCPLVFLHPSMQLDHPLDWAHSCPPQNAVCQGWDPHSWTHGFFLSSFSYITSSKCFLGRWK